LRRAYSTFENASEEIWERILRLENSWLKLEYQLNVVRDIHSLMSQNHQELYKRTLRMLLSKLDIVNSKLMSLVSHDDSLCARLTYAWKKEGLDEAINELEVWQRTADQSWFLGMRIASPLVDVALPTNRTSTAVSTTTTSAIRAGLIPALPPRTIVSGLKLDYGDISSMAVKDVAFSEARIASRINQSGESAFYILNDIIPAPGPGGSEGFRRQAIRRNARELASRLQNDDPGTFGLLACKGFTMDPASPKITMVFRVPPSLGNPQSLRDLLLNAQGPPSLTQRLYMAKDLAKSVGYVHTFGFVHKNILVGLDNFRKEEGNTENIGDNFVERNLYRHPSRQGSSPTCRYIMQHDIYSLGVCLLEIGLWKSFIEYPRKNGKMMPQWSSVLGIPKDLNPVQAIQYLCSNAKKNLVSLAQDELPQYMGWKYTDVVMTCLTCLDPENEDFGDEEEFQDEEGILVGVRYIEKVGRRHVEVCKIEVLTDDIQVLLRLNSMEF
jgi:hypothetical protein